MSRPQGTHCRRPAVRRRLTRMGALATLALMIALVCSSGASQASTLFFPRAIAEETNALYNHNCLWGGPRGMDYAALPEPQPIQIPNLYPDKGSTYFVAQIEMPENSSLTIRGTYPRERYFSFTVANLLAGGAVGNGDFIRDEQIEPDPGSVNPFQISPGKNDRTPTGQTYTVHVVRGPVPADPAPNTLYTTSTSATEEVRLSMRNYIPDQGLGGTGGVELPTVTLTLANGETVTEPEAVCTALKANKTATVTGFPQATWEKQIAKSSEPVNAPIKATPEFELFWNNNYNILGLFSKTPLERVEKYPATNEGGYATNPDTRYLLAGLSLNYGNVVVVHGKLPSYQHTRPNAASWSSTNPQIRYWSICTAQGPVSGKGSDCAYDQQVPLNQNGEYTVVISKEAHRPANASDVCGAKWLNFGTGEGEIEGSTPPNRSWIGTVYIRYMDALSGSEWPQSPKNIGEPTKSNPKNEAASVMGEYTPVASYTNQAAYEAKGCSTGAPSLSPGSSTSNTGAFTLRWNAVTNALPQLYTLEHKSASGKWEKVASGLKDPEYTFTAGSPEAEGTWTYRVGAIDEGASETEPAEGDYGAAAAQTKVDRTAPPAPTAAVSRAPDAGGFYRGAVEVSFVSNGTATLPDGSEGAALEASSLTRTQDVTASGTHEVCGTVEDVLGNKSAPACVTVKLDNAAPPTPTALVSRAPDYAGGGGWYKGSVDVSFASNGVATLPDGTEGAALEPSSLTGPVEVATTGSHTVCGTVEDVLGNLSAPGCATVQVDATPPSLTLNCPATAELDAAGVRASYSANDGTGQSGLASSPSGTLAINTASLGEQVTTETARDNVGNETTRSCTTDVIYRFTGLKPATGTKVTPGKTVKVSFRLGDALGYVTDGSGTLQLAKEGGSYGPAVDFVNMRRGLYQYQLSTSGLTAGKYTLLVRVNDGTTHTTTITVK